MAGSTVRTIELPAPESRIVILGDPHGDAAAVDAALACRAPLDLAIAVGDVVGYADGPACDALVAGLTGRGVLSVRGNHEEWAQRDGKLAFVSDHRADRRLSAATLAWMAGLPDRIEVRDPRDGATLAVILHSIRSPAWDDVRPHNVGRLLAVAAAARLVVVGHSHCPRVLVPVPGGRHVEQPFDFTRQEDLAVPIAPGTPVVDVGSLGRPRRSFESREEARSGTYGIVDFGAATVELRVVRT